MTKRRVRLNDDNDPLSSTDKVLASFEQISKSSSKQYDNSTSQQYDTITSQPDNNLTSQPETTQHLSPQNSSSNAVSLDLKSQEPDQPNSQVDDTLTSQPDNNLTSQQEATQHLSPQNSSSNTVSLDLKSQEPDQSNSQVDDTLTSQPDKNSGIQQANLSTSQQVSTEKPKLRKSTFQISEVVLHQLDQLHLTLQLSMGKANAPYKEVIVEEALVRLLEKVNSDRAALIEALVSRHNSRNKI